MLTQEQIQHFATRLTRNGTPVRFMIDGCSVNIETGARTPKGSNVMSQIVYWSFDRETAREIAKTIGARAVFSN
tara:strand:- start:15 stop:236 length:222 start_codon:yes stop_codon:yes gene_type:complete